MAKGGARKGAGRPKGSVSKLDSEARSRAFEGGLLPLDYLLAIMRDELQPQETRIDAAKAAAPYCHARLQTISAEVTGKEGGPIETKGEITLETARRLAFVLEKGRRALENK